MDKYSQLANEKALNDGGKISLSYKPICFWQGFEWLGIDEHQRNKEKDKIYTKTIPGLILWTLTCNEIFKEKQIEPDIHSACAGTVGEDERLADGEDSRPQNQMRTCSSPRTKDKTAPGRDETISGLYTFDRPVKTRSTRSRWVRGGGGGGSGRMGSYKTGRMLHAKMSPSHGHNRLLLYFTPQARLNV